ncbi:reverse transcriptase family protein [Piscinibacter gummiphilus]|nr:reverse transcriptase family protein [Piscinibacter gummiphilus]
MAQSGNQTELEQSPLFGISDPRELAELVATPLPSLWRIARARDNYTALQMETGGKLRTVNRPCRALGAVQRRIQHLLSFIPLPDYLHSGVPGRSNLTNATVHRDGAWLCQIDLKAFFVQVTDAKVFHFFWQRMQCEPEIATLLTRLNTTNGHVPLGGHCSLQLAFLVAQPLLDDLDRTAREEDIRFSTYVDDLSFSGAKATPSFLWAVKQIIHRHGFRYHHDRCHRPGGRRLVTGVLLHKSCMEVRPQLVQRIWTDWSAMFTAPSDDASLRPLQGRLAVASQIEPRYREAHDSMKVMRKTLRDSPEPALAPASVSALANRKLVRARLSTSGSAHFDT